MSWFDNSGCRKVISTSDSWRSWSTWLSNVAKFLQIIYYCSNQTAPYDTWFVVEVVDPVEVIVMLNWIIYVNYQTRPNPHKWLLWLLQVYFWTIVGCCKCMQRGFISDDRSPFQIFFSRRYILGSCLMIWVRTLVLRNHPASVQEQGRLNVPPWYRFTTFLVTLVKFQVTQDNCPGSICISIYACSDTFYRLQFSKCT